MATARGLMQRLAHASTRVIAVSRGDAFPFYYVSEYPKSGGTWLSRMLADAMQLPFPQRSIFPLGFSCVIQNHWGYSPRLSRCVYLHRDGRDVMVSYFFHTMLHISRGQSPWAREKAREFDRLFGKGFDPENTVELLPKFIENAFRNPRGARLNWARHVESWLPARGRPLFSFVSYSELRNDCAGALQRVLREIGREDVPEVRIHEAVERFSMKRMTGRSEGQEDRGHYIRKGAVGDWRNHFSRDAAEVFDDLAGDALVALGYEPDRDWVRRGDFAGDVERAVQGRVAGGTEAEERCQGAEREQIYG